MKKFKKYLLFLVLVVASMCCLTSCSCSFGKNSGGGDGGGGDDGSAPLPVTTYYEVTVSITAGGGTCLSSTGSDIHLEGSSPVYTVVPNETWGIKKIVVNDEVWHDSTTDGYLFRNYDITLDKISQNSSIEVVLEQVQFKVSYTVLNSGYSVSSGASVVTDSASDIYMGGTDCEYSIVPTAGYVIYSVKINGEDYYSYSPADNRASLPMVLEFDSIDKHINIEVQAYKLESVGFVIENYNSGGFNKLGESAATLLEESKVLASLVVDGFDGLLIPNGYGGKAFVNVKSGARMVGYMYSVDGGESYSSYFSVDQNNGTPHDFVSYDSEGNFFIIKEISTNFRLRVYTESDDVLLTIYNLDANDGEQKTTTTTIAYYSYYIVPSEFVNNYSWYYSTSVVPEEPNTHRAVEFVSATHPVSGDTVYSIYLDPAMINANGRFVLLYSKN